MQREMESIERIRAEPSQGGKRPEDMSPQELHAVLWQVLTFRDSVVKKIEKTIERIPGLGALIEKLMDSISVFVFTTLEPFLKPIMKSATSGLMAASGEVINSHDQYEVFNDPRASDPTHSFLSKDHFNLILNEPAGNLGKIILTHAVQLIVKAWDDQSMNVHAITEDILQCLFHPDFHDRGSAIQREMMEYMQKWVQGLGSQQHDTLRRLTKEAVREHKNTRLPGQGGPPANEYNYAENAGHQAQHDLQGYLSQVPVVSNASSFLGKLSPGSGGKPSGGSSFPGMGQAQSLLNQFNQFSGPRRDVSPSAAGYPGERYETERRRSWEQPQAEASYLPPPGPPSSFPGATPHDGYAPSYGAPAGFPEPANYGDGYAPPPGPPPGFPDPGSYAPPPGPPPGQGYNYDRRW
ncbi:hypothetical protein QCA50_018497 [Cerrena zonata]|uniref:Uncharacterized protein n=1 Tax=Cerrena zonata TaxID=2478898 RepID=A0AAW0FGL6_9APHY